MKAKRLIVFTLLAVLLLSTFACGGGEEEAAPAQGKIAFSSDRAFPPEIYVMDADGSDQTRLTNNLATDDSPSWSP